MDSLVASIVWLVLVTAAGAFGALWAQGAAVNRGMRSALVATLLFVAALLTLVGLLGLVFPGSAPAGLVVPGLVVGLVFWPRLRRFAARFIPISATSTTHAVALIVTLLMLLFGAVKLVAGPVAETPVPGSTIEVIAQALALAVLAAFSVGLWLRRSWSATRQRLGLTRPGLRETIAALALGGLVAGVTLALRALAPGSAPTDALLAAQTGAPLARLAAAVAVAVGYELVFRGALQPRLGLLLSSLAFLALVLLPPVSVAWLGPVLLTLSVGLLRRRGSTTACIMAHALALGIVAFI